MIWCTCSSLHTCTPPQVLLESGSVHPVALLTGTVKDEWTRNIGWFIQELYADMPHLGTCQLVLQLASDVSKTSSIARHVFGLQCSSSCCEASRRPRCFQTSSLRTGSTAPRSSTPSTT